jgi:transglutaminase-like putative cysteine protease
MTWIARLLRRFAPREGWFRYLLTLVLLVCAPLALWEVNRGLGAERLILLTLAASVTGVGLAKSPIRPGWAAALHSSLGVAIVMQAVGRILPPLPPWLQDAHHAVDWFRLLRTGVVTRPYPFPTVRSFIGQRAGELITRLEGWSIDSGDALVFTLLVGLLAWGAVAVSTWFLYRRRQPLVGLLFPGVATAEVVFLTNRGSLWLAVFAAGTLAWLAAFHADETERRWQAMAIDYPTDIRMELALAVALLTFGLVGAGAAFPLIRLRPITQAVWGTLDKPWQAVEGTSRRLLGLPQATAVIGAPGLPNEQLIGAGPELSEVPVLRVHTDDPPPSASEGAPPQRYWRGATYDIYTGSGWSSSSTAVRTLLAEQPLEPFPVDRPILVQRVEHLAGPGPVLYAANAPEHFDQPVTVRERAPGDLAHISARLERYTAISRPPEPSRAELRAASVAVPEAWERFLSLPEDVPSRVLDLAREVGGDAATAFDQALRLEAFLRTYTYTLDLPAPPAEQDVADYFLFDLQQGYCDYYATAMAVMARALGLPARLATGFVQGTLDPETGGYLVTEAEAHSWVEIFFDGIGWVEFEPTAGRPGLARQAAPVADVLPPPPPIPAQPMRQPVGFPPWVWIGGLSLVALAAWVILRRRPRVRTANELVVDRFGRLLHWGARLDHPLADGQTPNEYATDLAQSLTARAEGSRLGRVRAQANAFRPEVRVLGEAFTHAQYAPHPTSAHEGTRIQQLWDRLRRWLWLLWLGGQRTSPDRSN